MVRYNAKGDQRKSEILSIPISRIDLDRLETRARMVGMTKTEYARQAVFDALSPPQEARP
jgi:hypothetical protein